MSDDASEQRQRHHAAESQKERPFAPARDRFPPRRARARWYPDTVSALRSTASISHRNMEVSV